MFVNKDDLKKGIHSAHGRAITFPLCFSADLGNLHECQQAMDQGA